MRWIDEKEKDGREEVAKICFKGKRKEVPKQTIIIILMTGKLPYCATRATLHCTTTQTTDRLIDRSDTQGWKKGQRRGKTEGG